MKSDGVSEDNPYLAAQRMVLRQADELSKQFHLLEEQISFHGRILDNLTKARDVVETSLRGTEELRANIAAAQAEEDLDFVETSRNRAIKSC